MHATRMSSLGSLGTITKHINQVQISSWQQQKTELFQDNVRDFISLLFNIIMSLRIIIKIQYMMYIGPIKQYVYNFWIVQKPVYKHVNI